MAIQCGVNGWSQKKNKRKYFRNTRNTFKEKLLGPHSSSIDEHGNVFVICYYGRTLWKLDASGYASKTLADDVLFGPASMSRMDRAFGQSLTMSQTLSCGVTISLSRWVDWGMWTENSVTFIS